MTNRSVSARGDVSRSVIVTGDGNSVSLSFGTSGIVLPVDRKQIPGLDRRRRQEGDERLRELDVLDPVRGRLPLIGRERELADLQAWLEDDVDISIHALTGPAGTGKTRLAIGLCAAVDGAQAPGEGWVAGFLSPSVLPRLADVYATTTFDWAQSTLLVIDYAAQGHEALGRWLDRLATQELDGVKLRLLLLDRQAPEGYGWWHELHDSPLNAAAGRRELIRQPRPAVLPGLGDLEIRRRVVAEALAATAKLHGETGSEVPEAGVDATFDARLSEPVFGNALSLVMAGVIAHEQDLRSALALRRLDAARHLGRRELARLEALAGTTPEARALRHLVAFNGMTGGLSVEGLGKTLQVELEAIAAVADTPGLADLLQQELPPPTTREEGLAVVPRLGTIQPDLIGEAVIVEAFEAPPSRQAEGVPAVRRAYALGGAEAAQALMRLLQDYAYAVEDPEAGDGERETGNRLLGWLRSLAAEIKDPAALEPLAFALPKDTLVLREIAADITGRLAKAYVAILDGEEEASPGAVLRAVVWTTNFSTRLNELGDRIAALAASEKATQLVKGLLHLDDPEFRDKFATSLSNQAIHLFELGRRDDALAAAEEAVKQFRNLAAALPNTFGPYLAGSLSNQASFLFELGRREDALKVMEEAVALYRTLAGEKPEAFTPDFAQSLSNRANCLSALGQHEEALATAEEAVKLYRPIVAKKPDAYTPNLANSLNTLANRFAILGRFEEALTVAEEAVALHHALAEVRPEAFASELAMSLQNLGNILADLGRPEEALKASEEAVILYRELNADNPETFLLDLAMSLSNQSNRLSALGKRHEALAAVEEAVVLQRTLAATKAGANKPNLATSLNNLANRLTALGRLEEALEVAEEAVELRRALFIERPDAFSIDLSTSLGMFTDLMITMHDQRRALNSITEAIEVLKPVFLEMPQAVARWMAMHLKRYLLLCKQLDRVPDDALLSPIIEKFNTLKET